MRILRPCSVLWLSVVLAGCAGSSPPDAARPIIAEAIAASQVDLLSTLDPEDLGCWREVPQGNDTKAPDMGKEPKQPPAPPKVGETVTGRCPENVNPYLPESGATLPTLWNHLDIAAAVWPEASRAAANDDEGVKRDRVRLTRAFAGYYRYGDAKPRRSRVSEQLIAASNANCAGFLRSLHGTQSAANFFLGSLATATTGAGAIVTDLDAARSLSGVGSILTGVRAEMNEDYFRNIFSDALEKAIEKQRSQTLATIRNHYNEELTNYPVEAAVGDAILYNAQCSVISGLGQISNAVAMSDDPAGLRALRAALARSGYDAKINLQALSTAMTVNAMDAVPVARSAEAAADAKEIDAEVARLLAYAAAATSRISSATDDKKTKATNAIIAAVKPFTELASNAAPPTGAISVIKNQIVTMATTYDAMAKTFTNAPLPSDSDRVTRLLQANDAQAAAVMRVFREYVSDAFAKIDAAEATTK